MLQNASANWHSLPQAHGEVYLIKNKNNLRRKKVESNFLKKVNITDRRISGQRYARGLPAASRGMGGRERESSQLEESLPSTVHTISRIAVAARKSVIPVEMRLQGERFGFHKANDETVGESSWAPNSQGDLQGKFTGKSCGSG